MESLAEQTELADLRFSGAALTWCNNHMDSTRLYCNLDRILVNNYWMTIFDTLEANFLEPGVSDHIPGILSVYTGSSQKKHIFRFCNF